MAYKILMIDDDAELLKMLRKYFEMKNYKVITAENGAEGFCKIGLEPDIILLDVNMPRIDGIEVCQRIRDKVACPILFLTARVDEQDVVNGLSSGGDDYILKPFSLKELDARIQAHLKREARRKGRSDCCFQGELSIDYKEETGTPKAILREETGENVTEKIVTDNGSVVGIKRQELLYLPKGKLPYGVGVDDIFQFAYGNHISRILVNIPENEKLLAHYRESGFHKAYLYRCYQKED